MLNQRVMATAIIRKNGRFLMLKRSKGNRFYAGYWQFPEGGVEFGESLEQALAREVKEETGLRIKKADLLGLRSSCIEYFRQKLWHFMRAFYATETAGKIRLSAAHSEYKWVSRREMAKLKLLKGLRYGNFRALL